MHLKYWLSRSRKILGRIISNIHLIIENYIKTIASIFTYIYSFGKSAEVEQSSAPKPQPFAAIAHVIFVQTPVLIGQFMLDVLDFANQIAEALMIVPEQLTKPIKKIINNLIAPLNRFAIKCEKVYEKLTCTGPATDLIESDAESDPNSTIYKFNKAIKAKTLIGLYEQTSQVDAFLSGARSNPDSKKHFLLVSGPGGVGKTELIRNQVRSSGFSIIEFENVADNDQYVSNLENRIREFFTKAKISPEPVCLFIEDMDQLGDKTSSDTVRAGIKSSVASTLKKEISSLTGTTCVLIGETKNFSALNQNVRDACDNSIINIPLPSKEIRQAIIQSKLENLDETNIFKDPVAPIIKQVVEATSAWSPKRIVGYLDSVLKHGLQQGYLNQNTFSLKFDSFRIEFEQDMLPLSVIAPSLKFKTVDQASLNLVSLDPKIQRELDSLCAFLNDPQKYMLSIPGIAKRLLLKGPPGTGKTSIARYVANQTNALFIYIDAGKFKDDKPEYPMVENFELAKKFEKAVIFIDEIDAVSKPESHAREQLQTAMDGFAQNKFNTLVVIAATNHAEDMTKSMLSRFTTKISVPLPTIKQRSDVFKHYLQLANIKFDKYLQHCIEKGCIFFAKNSDGLSQRDIEGIYKEAGAMGVEAGGTLNFLHVVTKLKEIMSENGLNCSSKLIDCYDLWQQWEKWPKPLTFRSLANNSTGESLLSGQANTRSRATSLPGNVLSAPVNTRLTRRATF